MVFVEKVIVLGYCLPAEYHGDMCWSNLWSIFRISSIKTSVGWQVLDAPIVCIL